MFVKQVQILRKDSSDVLCNILLISQSIASLNLHKKPSFTAPPLVPNYTVWWQRQVCTSVALHSTAQWLTIIPRTYRS